MFIGNEIMLAVMGLAKIERLERGLFKELLQWVRKDIENIAELGTVTCVPRASTIEPSNKAGELV